MLIGTQFLTAPDPSGGVNQVSNARASGGVNQVSNARALSLSAQALSLLRYNRQVVLVTVVQYNDSISAYVTKYLITMINHYLLEFAQTHVH